LASAAVPRTFGQDCGRVGLRKSLDRQTPPRLGGLQQYLPGPDHDDFGSVRSEIINVIDSFWLERDAGGKPVPLFLIPL